MDFKRHKVVNKEVLHNTTSLTLLKGEKEWSEFWLKEVEFLGHVVSGKGTKVDPKKMKVVRN